MYQHVISTILLIQNIYKTNIVQLVARSGLIFKHGPCEPVSMLILALLSSVHMECFTTFTLRLLDVLISPFYDENSPQLTPGSRIINILEGLGSISSCSGLFHSVAMCSVEFSLTVVVHYQVQTAA